MDVDAAVQLMVLRELLASHDKACLDNIASSMGYTSEGISKHSAAAKCQSLEARLYDGGVPKMRNGGVTARMQSVGATGKKKTVCGAELLERLALAGFGKKRLKRFERALKLVHGLLMGKLLGGPGVHCLLTCFNCIVADANDQMFGKMRCERIKLRAQYCLVMSIVPILFH